MRIIAQDKDGMTLYAQWYSTDGRYAMRYDDGSPMEIIDLDKNGYKIMAVDDNYFEKHLKNDRDEV